MREEQAACMVVDQWVSCASKASEGAQAQTNVTNISVNMP
jgi:hypothetical protein